MPFASTAEIMRRFGQLQQTRHLFCQRGFVVEIFKCQFNERELIRWREFPGQFQFNGLGQGGGGLEQLGRLGFVKAQQDLRGFHFDPFAGGQLHLCGCVCVRQHPATLQFACFFK